MKGKIIDLLKSTNRANMDLLVDFMEAGGFFEAPCSGGHHLAKPGGLAEHSLNVYFGMLELDKAMKAELPHESIVICGILHDLGKIGDYGKPNYVENILKSGKPAAKPYKTNPNLLYVPHEIRSVAIAERYISLTEQEQFAILYHNGMYSDLRYSYKDHETPLSLILHFSDMWCSRVTEIEEGGEEE